MHKSFILNVSTNYKTKKKITIFKNYNIFFDFSERLSTIEPPTLRDTPGLIFGESTSRYPPVSSEHPDSTSPRRQCHPFHIEYCKQLPYNFTSFPNAMGHLTFDDAKVDLERFK